MYLKKITESIELLHLILITIRLIPLIFSQTNYQSARLIYETHLSHYIHVDQYFWYRTSGILCVGYIWRVFSVESSVKFQHFEF